MTEVRGTITGASRPNCRTTCRAWLATGLPPRRREQQTLQRSIFTGLQMSTAAITRTTVACSSTPRSPDTSKADGQSCSGGSSNNSGSCSSWAELSRRALLQGLTIGGAYAWAARSARSAAAPPETITSSSTSTLEARLEERVHEFTLANGLRFIVSERHAAPIVSCHVHADVGAWDEEDGLTGIAHLLEHLAFKGTPRIGTKDYQREAPLLEALDDVFYSIREAGSGREAARLQQRLLALQAEAAQLSVPNEYGALLQRQGAVGLNAATSQDSTKYYCSLPANKLELWFALESERFQVPVFREVYQEKAVVSEERRMRVDNSPLGPFQEAFSLASLTNNYRRPVIGYQADIDRIGRREVRQFFNQHYVPGNLVVAIAGDVTAEQVRSLAETYFGSWEPGTQALGSPAAAPSSTGSSSTSSTGSSAANSLMGASLPGAAGGAGLWWGGELLPRPSSSAGGELQFKARARAGPALMQAFYRPSVRSSDALALEMVSDLLSGSRSSRLYKNLVLEGKALTASAISSYPGEKHAGQFIVYGIPTKGSSLEQLEADISAQLAALADEGPTPSELLRYKKGARAALLASLTSNSAVAATLADYQVLRGSWRCLLEDLQGIETMGAAQVREAAARLFQPSNSYRGYVLPAK